MKIPFKIKNLFFISFYLNDLVLLIFLLSYINFNGGIIKPIDLINLNNYSDLYYLIYYLIFPFLCFYSTYIFFLKEKVKINIKPFSFVLSFFILLILASNYLKTPNIFADEFYYSNQCLNIANSAITYLNFNIFSEFSYGGILRIILSFQWILLLTFFNYLTIIDDKNKALKFLLVFFLLKFLMIYFKIDHSIHPPLNLFLPSLSFIFLGFNTISLKLSIIIINLFFIIYIYNRINFSRIFILFTSIIIYTLPIIGNFTTYFEQSIFSFFCFTIILIEIHFKKTHPKYLFLIVSIFSLFRYVSIAAYPLVFVYSVVYYRDNYQKKREHLLSFFKNFIPILFSFPFILSPLLFGTPSTEPLHQLNFKLFNIEESLLFKAFSVYNNFLLIIFIFFIFVLWKKQFRLFIYTIIIFISYHICYKFSSASGEWPKYFIEQFGYIFVFSIIYLSHELYKTRRLTYSLKLFFLCSFFFLISTYKSYITKQNIKNLYLNQNFSQRNNHYDYLVDYIETNDIYNEALIIGVDNGPFFQALYNSTFEDFLQYQKNWKKYRVQKQKNKIGWWYIDPLIINNLKSINYVLVTDYLYKTNKKNIKSLISIFNWETLAFLPRTYNNSGIHILTRSKRSNTKY